MDIEGKVALITGGAGGLGKCVGELLLSRAAQGVVFIDKDEDMGKVTEDYLKKTYGESKVVFVHGDVTVKLNLKCAYEMTKSKFGRLDIVCNNAGIFNELEMEKMFAVNIMALITSTYMAVEYMGKQHGGQGGVIINVSSNLGKYALMSLFLRILINTLFKIIAM
uniref:15-hydroxyprostaglandin dehydrogenase [NAD(+)] n=1 Tax=Saccoglossus kowalevskii TaxID=10224 RepID=A0ABM0M527_SACKO|nr:PREDICTED: 15-hydroxyprostaglandin dehydrogenase [NAD(+)]-like [Saccoglossus kowalevskii]